MWGTHFTTIGRSKSGCVLVSASSRLAVIHVMVAQTNVNERTEKLSVVLSSVLSLQDGTCLVALPGCVPQWGLGCGQGQL